MSLMLTEVTLLLVRLDLVHPFETSSHRKSYLEHIIVRAAATDGQIQYRGWGECASPSEPFYGPETTESCWGVLDRHLIPLVLGRWWETPADARGFIATIAGNNFARAGLEMACWDVFAQSRGVVLARALTEDPAGEVEAGVSLGIERTIDDLLEQVERQVSDGYRRVKLKIRPGWDVEPVAAVRSAFPSVVLQVDANASYSGCDLQPLHDLDAFALAMIEQPFAADDLLSHADLAMRLATPICLDESITSVAALRTALALRAGSVVNVKVSRLGGISPAVAVHDVCVAHGIPVWCGGMHEFGIGRAANLAVASLPGFTLPSDVSGSDKYYLRDIVLPPIHATSGLVPVPATGSGLGVAVDENTLAQSTMASKTVALEGARQREGLTT